VKQREIERERWLSAWLSGK